MTSILGYSLVAVKRFPACRKTGGCMPIISNLGTIMKKKNITYEDLQLLSQVAPDTIARARDGRIATCKLATLEKLATALDVDVCQLFRHVSSPEDHAGRNSCRP